MKKQFKSSASAARAFGGAPTGFASLGGFATALSSLSYLNELPDLASISDPNVVVAFKNLSKRDSTTKSKALEDLQSLLLASDEDIEEGVLDAWTSLYPRTSNDNSRRVRQLAHTLQGHVGAKSGKRIAKRVPNVIGPWLEGLYDSDKAVTKAASEALDRVFTSPEKRSALWSVYQEPILDYCINVFDKESPQTLSDERSVSTEEANAKYHRVLTSTFGLLCGLISGVNRESFGKHASRYNGLLQDNRIWENATSEDVSVRRATHKALQSLLKSDHGLCPDLSMLSKFYVAKSLTSDQMGSAVEMLETTRRLTLKDARLWTELWTDKKTPVARLKTFLKRGSQASPATFWGMLTQFLQALPSTMLPTSLEEARELAQALHSGITRKDEPRTYLADGYATYLNLASVLVPKLSETDASTFLDETLSPLLAQYLLPEEESAKWSMPTNAAKSVFCNAARDEQLKSALIAKFDNMSSTDISRQLRLSLPESAREYSRSQDELGRMGQRCAIFLSAMMPLEEKAEDPSQVLSRAVKNISQEAMEVLFTRNGKPYGVAALLADVAEACRPVIRAVESVSSIFEDFLKNRIASIYVSPSYKHLSRILAAFEDQVDVCRAAWHSSLDAVLAHDSVTGFAPLAELLGSRQKISGAELENLRSALNSAVMSKFEKAWDQDSEWDEISRLLSVSSPARELFGNPILDGISDGLVVEPRSLAALNHLRDLTRGTPNALKVFSQTDAGKKLLPKLLLLSEAPETGIANKAKEMISIIQGLIGSEITPDGTGSAVLDVLQDGLAVAGPNSVSIDTLINHAHGLVHNNLSGDVDKLLPNPVAWHEALSHFLAVPIDRSLAMTSPLVGAVFLVESAPVKSMPKTPRDVEGLSIPLRMAMYTTRLLQTGSMIDVKSIASSPLFEPFVLTVQLANDHLSVSKPSNLWSRADPDLIDGISDFVAVAQQMINQSASELPDTVEQAFSRQEPDSPGSQQAYYKNLFTARKAAELAERNSPGSEALEEVEKRLKARRSDNDTSGLVSELVGHQLMLSSSPYVTRLGNELVADLTSLPDEKLHDTGLRQLVVLDVLLDTFDDLGDTVQKARLSRFVSKAVSWLADESVEDELVTEVYRVLVRLLPLVSDMYGDHWKELLDSIHGSLELVSELPDSNAPALIPALHAALRLYGVLRRIQSSEASKADDERNDDVIDAWNETEKDMAIALINALRVPRTIPDEQHQPLLIFNELLSREITRLPTSRLGGAEELYPQLYSSSPAIQQATYRLLHRYVPSKQEQRSVETLLEKSTARLPDELLSLILEVPAAEDFDDEDFRRSVPLQLRGYLLSWLLIFDHFTNASYKLKNDYVESMRETNHLNELLDFTFDFLGHARGKPINASPFDIATYNSSALEDQPLKDTQWLLIHLYYQSLTYFPTLSKQWWMDLRTRQKSIAVESWTAKHISPLVISSALNTVVTWSSTQEQQSGPSSDEPPPLTIKANFRGAELTASYAMDDDNTVAILVSLPPTYPLHNARVSSATKSMAVEQRKWEAWLRNSQGTIAFSNNSIVDGLLAWRRNVFGALKGQTECAICYSVVGEDGRVPSKKCRTCRNSFHGGCLYKWFKSSNGTSCPLCRESFNYG